MGPARFPVLLVPFRKEIYFFQHRNFNEEVIHQFEALVTRHRVSNRTKITNPDKTHRLFKPMLRQQLFTPQIKKPLQAMATIFRFYVAEVEEA
jgi:hypothetical protein